MFVVDTNGYDVSMSSSCEKDNGPQTAPGENTSWLSEFVGRIPDAPSQGDDCIATYVNGIAMYGDVVLPDVASVFHISKRRFELSLSSNAATNARAKTKEFISVVSKLSYMPPSSLWSYLAVSCLLLNLPSAISNSILACDALLAAVDMML